MIDPSVFTQEGAVAAAWLFGSRARGDFDEFSDTDVVVFCTTDKARDLVSLKRRMTACIVDDTVSLSLYSARSTEAMAQHGSLFLWHLKLEGHSIFERDSWLSDLLAFLRPYQSDRAKDDLLTLRLVLEEAQQSLQRTSLTLIYEAATLFTVLRNIGNVGMALLESPTFGRTLPISALALRMGTLFPISEDEVSELSQCKLAFSGKRREYRCVLGCDELLTLSARIGIVWDFVWEAACKG